MINTRPSNYLIAVLGLSAALLLPNASLAKQNEQQSTLNANQVRQGIQTHLEQNLYQLPPRVQGHYGIRLYRMTGDEKYANAALVDLYAVTESQSFYACQLDKPGFIDTEAREAIAILGKGPRAKARKKALQPFPEFLFYTDVLLRFSSRIDEFGLQGPCHDKLIKALKSTDLKTGLTDKAMIEAWAAQLINYAYWAKQLEVGDYIADYKQAFNDVYPASRDSKLNKKQFRNKIYGMTHFIFAASEYYQQPVDAKEFAWILDYFAANIERILADATDDIIAEVGISFHLAGLSQHPVVTQTQRHIINAYDETLHTIPSPKGNPDLALGEHRNVLAMMLLNWPTTLHQGPYFHKLKRTQKYLPKQVSIKP